MRTFALGAVAALAMLTAFSASNTAQAANCSVSNVSLVIGAVTYTPTACVMNVDQGGGPGAETASINAQLGTSLTFLDGSDSSAVNYQGLSITTTATGTTSGTWTMAWSDINGAAGLNLPITLDLAFGLFGGNNADAYFFNNVLLPVTPNTGNGTFNIVFLNGGGQIPDLSHTILLGGDPQSVAAVPEPASIALFGVGMLGLGYIRNRRRSI